jgi:hypothetical protein
VVDVVVVVVGGGEAVVGGAEVDAGVVAGSDAVGDEGSAPPEQAVATKAMAAMSAVAGFTPRA